MSGALDRQRELSLVLPARTAARLSHDPTAIRHEPIEHSNVFVGRCGFFGTKKTDHGSSCHFALDSSFHYFCCHIKYITLKRNILCRD